MYSFISRSSHPHSHSHPHIVQHLLQPPHLHRPPHQLASTIIALTSASWVTKHRFTIFGPTAGQWEKWADKKIEWEDNTNWDPRTLSKSEIAAKFGFSERFVKPQLPLLELPKQAWYTNDHMYVQQTELDDIWRVGFTSLKFIGNRHVEWLEFDCEKGDKKLYSESFLYYSVCDWFPLKTINQSINDIQFSVSLPFHRCQVIAYNEKIEVKPSLLIDDDLHPDWRWALIIKWTNANEDIFDRAPIIDGRYGQWFDEQSYVDFIKDNGDYKNWQWDQCAKLSEGRNLTWSGKLNQDERTFKQKWFRDTYVEDQVQYEMTDLPKYQRLDQQMMIENGSQPNNGGGGKKVMKTSWKPNWWPW